jgi:Cu/Ag efflux protein CusF
MLRSIAIAVLLGLTVVSFAVAAETEGKIQSVNGTDRTVTLDNGATIWLSDSVTLDAVKEGAEVKVVYEEKDGKAVATSVEVK